MKNWRKMTWALIAWSGLTVLWLAAGIASATSKTSHECKGVSWGEHACHEAANAGMAIGVGLVLGVGFAGFIVLSLVWLMSRPKGAS